jgi:hypothetical protein
MGGKSSSSSSSTQNSSSAENSGVTTADVIFQGQSVTYTSDFDPLVSQQFQNLIEIVANAGEGLFSLANKSLDLVDKTGDRALTEVSTQETQTNNPQLAIINNFLPVIMLATVGFFAYTILRKR